MADVFAIASDLAAARTAHDRLERFRPAGTSRDLAADLDQIIHDLEHQLDVVLTRRANQITGAHT